MPPEWNGDRQSALAGGYEGLGDVLQAETDLNGAKAEYQHAFDIRQRLTEQAPGNRDWQYALSTSVNNLGAVLQALEICMALREIPACSLIQEELVEQEPRNNTWQRDLGASYIKLGDVLMWQGDLNGAKSQFQSALEIEETW